MSMYVPQSDRRVGRIIRHPTKGHRVKVLRVDACVVGFGAYTEVEYRSVLSGGRLGRKRVWTE